MAKNIHNDTVALIAVLHFKPPSGNEYSVKLRRDATILGREKGDILLKDPEVSSSHCQIQNVAGNYYLFDMNSTNGTLVNGDKIIRKQLQAGDVVTIGQTIVTFAFEQEAKARHIATVFYAGNDGDNETKASLVDTLIESRINQSPKWVLQIDITYKDGTRESNTLQQEITYLGRASSFGKFDLDSRISRKHVMVKRNSHGEVFVEDQGSTNGVFVDGARVQGIHRISPDQIVQIGDTQFSLRPIKKE